MFWVVLPGLHAHGITLLGQRQRTVACRMREGRLLAKPRRASLVAWTRPGRRQHVRSPGNSRTKPASHVSRWSRMNTGVRRAHLSSAEAFRASLCGAFAHSEVHQSISEPPPCTPKGLVVAHQAQSSENAAPALGKRLASLVSRHRPHSRTCAKRHRRRFGSRWAAA